MCGCPLCRIGTGRRIAPFHPTHQQMLAPTAGPVLDSPSWPPPPIATWPQKTPAPKKLQEPWSPGARLGPLTPLPSQLGSTTTQAPNAPGRAFGAPSGQIRDHAPTAHSQAFGAPFWQSRSDQARLLTARASRTPSRDSGAPAGLALSARSFFLGRFNLRWEGASGEEIAGLREYTSDKLFWV